MWLLMSRELVFHLGMAGMFLLYGFTEGTRLTVLVLWLDAVILRVFPDLNDCTMIATLGWVSICIVRMRNQAVKGWRATAAQMLWQGKPGLL